MKVGVIGTGTMGNPMARCLIEAGHEVTVYDVRREATANLCEIGAQWTESPRAVAEASEVVITSLPGPPEMEKVVLDAKDGILAGLRRGSGYIDTTTNSPTVFRKVAEACQAQGIEVLDGPVSGRPPEMTIMIGGEEATLSKYRPVVEAMAKHIFHVGPLGAGCTAKLVTQYMGYCNFVSAAEALLIAAKAGIDLRTLAQIVPVSAGGFRLFDLYTQVFTRNFGEPGGGTGTLTIIAKDLELALELARHVQAPTYMGLIAGDLFKRAHAQGWGGYHFWKAIQLLEHQAEAELKVPAD